jgi:hypothetical protein
MKRSHHAAALGAVVVSLSSMLAVEAQGQAPATAPAPQTPIDTAAIGALNRMAAFMNTLIAMQVKAQVVTEKVLPDGQKIQRMANVNVIAERPGRLRLTSVDDRS